MKFLKQIKVEIKNILKSKFLLIIGILVILASFIPTIIGVVMQKINENNIASPMTMFSRAVSYSTSGVYYDKPYYPSEEPITVDGETINSDNPLYWNIKSYMENQAYAQADTEILKDSQTKKMVMDMFDLQIAFYVNAAKTILTYEDYRYDIIWQYENLPIEKYVYENNTSDPEILKTAAEYRWIYGAEDFNKKYIDITPEQRASEIAKIDEKLKKYNEVLAESVETAFPKYVEIKIAQEQDSIAMLNEQIAAQEKLIIENPSLEESTNNTIKEFRSEIERIETVRIPTLEYRLEKGIIPNTNTWQNAAISDIESNRYEITYTTIVSEEEFNKEQYLLMEYNTYANYVSKQNAKIDKCNENILIAQNSLDAGKPDMKYVYGGARQRTVSSLSFSIIVALFAILLGGWLIASEHQQGTIRLLMIKPKKRIKILMSKFIAALVLCFVIYIVGTVLNMITNGIISGFEDFAYPNYTVSGPVNFFADYIPGFFACTLSIIFAFCAAFMLSVIVKNTAVAVIIPVVCYIGCTILTQMIGYNTDYAFIFQYTPVAYVDIYQFFQEGSIVKYMINNGIELSALVGVIVLLIMAGICTFVSILTFKKQDIAN